MITKRRLKNKLKKLHKSSTVWYNTVGMVWLQATMADPTLLIYLSSEGLIWYIIGGNILIRVFNTNTSIEDK